MYKLQSFIAAEHGTRTWNACCLTGNVRQSPTMIWFHILRISRITHRIHLFLHLFAALGKWNVELSLDFLRSSFLTFRAYFGFDFGELSLSKMILLVVEIVLFEIQYIRDGVLQFQSLSVSLLPKFLNTTVERSHLMSLLHKFKPCLIEQMILVSIKKRFPNTSPVSKFEDIVAWEHCIRFPLKLRSLETNLSSNFLFLSDKFDVPLHSLLPSVHSLHQVSLKLWDSWKIGSLSFFVQSDKLELVLHFLVVPAHTSVKPAFSAFARHQGPNRAQCFLPTHKLNMSLIGALLPIVPHRFPPCSPDHHLSNIAGWPESCWVRSSWAHNLWRSASGVSLTTNIENWWCFSQLACSFGARERRPKTTWELS